MSQYQNQAWSPLPNSAIVARESASQTAGPYVHIGLAP